MAHWLETASKEQIEDAMQAFWRSRGGYYTPTEVIERLQDLHGLKWILPRLREQWFEICLESALQEVIITTKHQILIYQSNDAFTFIRDAQMKKRVVEELHRRGIRIVK